MSGFFHTSSIGGCNGGASERDGDVDCGDKGSDASVDGSKGDGVGGEDSEDDGKVGNENDGEVGNEDDEEVGDDEDGELGDDDDGTGGDEDDGEVGDEDDGEVGDEDDGVVGDEDIEQVGDEDVREDGDKDWRVNGASSRGGRQGVRTKKASEAARSVLYKARPGIAFTSGDAVLKAGVSHAVIALGVYRMVVGQRKARHDQATASLARGACPSPEIFVVGRRPRRSVRLLVSMASGCWVVSDTWLLDSLQQRAWKPCAEYVSPLLPGVLAARAAHAERRPLLDGLLVGCRGVLDVELDDFGLLVEAA